MIDLSVVVVTWNTRELVAGCLASVERVCAGEPLRSELIVVDNGSTDGTAEMLDRRFPGARRIAMRVNVGFAAGANAGIREASGRHLLLLNSDAQLCDDAASHCVGYLDAHPDVAMVGPRIARAGGGEQNAIRRFPRVATELVPSSVLQALLPRRFPSRRTAGAAPLDVEALLGAALFVRRAAIDAVGPLSEDYFFFLEETDWCWRMRAAGWRIVHLPGARVVHVSGASSKKKNAALTRIEYHRSLYRFHRKHRGTASMIGVLLLRAAKSLFYVVTQAPLALAGARHRARWRVHCDVLAWHLRGCPARIGVAQLGGPAPGGSTG